MGRGAVYYRMAAAKIYSNEELSLLESEGSEEKLLTIALLGSNQSSGIDIRDPDKNDVYQNRRQALDMFLRMGDSHGDDSQRDNRGNQVAAQDAEPSFAFTDDYFMPLLCFRQQFDMTNIAGMSVYCDGKDMFRKEFGLSLYLKPFVEVDKQDFIRRVRGWIRDVPLKEVWHLDPNRIYVADILGQAFANKGWGDHPGNAGGENGLVELVQAVLAFQGPTVIFVISDEGLSLCPNSSTYAKVKAHIDRSRDLAKRDFEKMLAAAEKAEWEKPVWMKRLGKLADRKPARFVGIRP